MCDDINLIFEAAFRNDDEEIIKLVKGGCDPNVIHPRSGHTPLQTACEMDSLSAIKALLEQGADPNLRFTKVSRVDGRTICSESVALMHVLSVDAAKLLVESGADKTLKDGQGLTAMDWMNSDNNEPVVTYLTEI